VGCLARDKAGLAARRYDDNRPDSRWKLIYRKGRKVIDRQLKELACLRSYLSVWNYTLAPRPTPLTSARYLLAQNRRNDQFLSGLGLQRSSGGIRARSAHPRTTDMQRLLQHVGFVPTSDMPSQPFSVAFLNDSLHLLDAVLCLGVSDQRSRKGWHGGWLAPCIGLPETRPHHAPRAV
jgi:hypothetical protein